MKSFKNLLEEIGPMLSVKPVDYEALIIRANQVIYHLLIIKTLTKSQSHLLQELCFVLHDYTGNQSTNRPQYAEDFEDNTCDYKIARELVLRFKTHNVYDELKDWANHYYVDGLLWYGAIEQMIAINSIPALVYGIEHTQPHGISSVKELRERYWTQLKSLDPTWDDIERIVINTSIPIKMVKEMFEYVLEKKLLEGHKNERYYLHFWEKTIKPAESVKKHIELFEKERPTLLGFLKEKPDK